MAKLEEGRVERALGPLQLQEPEKIAPEAVLWVQARSKQPRPQESQAQAWPQGKSSGWRQGVRG